MSGHSKWATIKHKKGAADAKRGKLFSKLIKEVEVAARMGGGDINGNARLRKAVSEARGAQMPGDNIQRAIKRGTGELEGVQYEEILYEGTGPGGTLYMVSVLTDNKNRTVAEVRKVFERFGGALGGGGAAQWAFDRKGIIMLPFEAIDEDKLMEVALEAGAENYSREGEQWQVLTEVGDLYAVVNALEAAGVKIDASEAGWVPKAKKPLSGRDAEKALGLYEALDDHEDTQSAYADFDIADDELARIAALAG